MSNILNPYFSGILTLTYCRAQSETSKGMTDKLVVQHDPDGWDQLLGTMVKYGKAYFREWV